MQTCKEDYYADAAHLEMEKSFYYQYAVCQAEEATERFYFGGQVVQEVARCQVKEGAKAKEERAIHYG